MGLASLLSGLAPIANQFLNQGSTNQANAGAAAGLKAYGGLTLPQLQQLLYTAQQSTSAAPYSASLAGTNTQGSNALNNINLSPQAMQAEQTSLGQLQGIAANNGLTPQTQAQLMAVRNQLQQTEQGQNQSILQQAQARGLGNSGIGIAAELSNNQGATNAAANAAYQAQAAQQAQQQQALTGAAQLGGQIYGQQYNQALNQAQAQNAQQQYNASQANQVGLQNANFQNQAAQQGVANAQQTALANQAATNTAQANNAANTLASGNQSLAQAGGISTAGQNVANQQNLQNKLNTATDAGAIGSLFGSPTANPNGSTNGTSNSLPWSQGYQAPGLLQGPLSSIGTTLTNWL